MKTAGWFALFLLVLAMIGVGAGLITLIQKHPEPNMIEPAGVGLVRLDGFVSPGESLSRSVDALDSLQRDPRVIGVILQANIVGGDEVGLTILQGRLDVFRQRNVPLVLAVDGALFGETLQLLLVSNKAIASSHSLFGTLASKRTTTIGTPPSGSISADASIAADPASSKDLDLPDLLIDLANARGIEPVALAQLAAGDVLTAAEAQQLRIIEQIGGLEDALAACGELAQLGAAPSIVVAGQKSIGEQFLGRLERLFDRIRPEVRTQEKEVRP